MCIIKCAAGVRHPEYRAAIDQDTMRHNGFLTRQGNGSAAEAAAQREDALRRWADDGGLTPEPGLLPPVAPTTAATAAARFGLPVRLVYRRAPRA